MIYKLRGQLCRSILGGTVCCFIFLLISNGIAGQNLSESAPAGTAPPPSWLAFNWECLSQIDGLSADFTHEVVHQLGAAASPMKGKILLKKGGKIRMEYAPPHNQLVVSDGTTIWAYHPSTNTVIESSAQKDPIVQATGIALDLSPENVMRHFRIDHLGGATSPKENKAGVLALTFLAPSGYAKQLVLTLEPRCPSIKRLAIIDKEGTAIRITLHNQHINPRLPVKDFTFKIKKGMKIVRP